MKRYFAIGIVFFVTVSVVFSEEMLDEEGPHQLGFGLNFWDTNDEPADYDSSGVSYYGTYRYMPGLWGIEANLEYYPKDSVYTDNAAIWEPQMMCIIGSWIYGGAGVGWPMGDSDIANNPAVYLKAGVNFSLTPAIKLDISGKYKYQKLKDFSNNNRKYSVDSVVIGISCNIAL